MFKKNSRVLSVLLSLVLVFGTMCVPAFATDAAAVNDAVVASVETYEIYSAYGSSNIRGIYTWKCIRNGSRKYRSNGGSGRSGGNGG